MLTRAASGSALAVMVWLRDLVQLLRGRLGPRSAAAPEFWLLLLCTTMLGTLGAHRVVLGRKRSAPLFPLLTIIGSFLTMDALTGEDYGIQTRAPKGAPAQRVKGASLLHS